MLGVTTGGGIDLNDRRPAVDLIAERTDSNPALVDDGSPESADSPNESIEELLDSPFDSPDAVFTPPPPPAPAFGSADSPDSSPELGSFDSVDSSD